MLLRLLLAIVAGSIYQNIDNFALAAAYRIKNIVIPWPANVLIATLSGVASGGAVALGCVLEDKAQELVGDRLKSVSCGILIMIGVWILVGHFRAKLFPQLGSSSVGDDAPPLPENVAARAEPTSIRTRETLVVALALAADNLAPSFLGGLSGTLGQNPTLTGILLATLTGLCSLVAVAQGQAVGRRGQIHLRHLAPDLVSGCMVIAIAFLGLTEDSNPLNPEKWFKNSQNAGATYGEPESQH